MAFDPDKYLAKKQSEFNPDSYLAKSDSLNELPYSKLASAAMGAAQGGSMGFADEIAGGARAGYNYLTDSKVQDFVEEYKKQRDLTRQEFEEAKENNPKSYLGGELVSGVGTALIPGFVAGKLGLNVAKSASAAKTVASGAGLGALAGLGGSDKDIDNEEILKDVKSGALMGGAAGTVGALLGGVRKLPEKFESIEDVVKAFKLGKKGVDVATKPGRIKAAEDMYALGKSTKEGLEQVEKDLSSKYGDILEDAKNLNLKDSTDVLSTEKLTDMISHENDPTRQKNILSLIQKVENLKKEDVAKGFNELGEQMTQDRKVISPKMLTNFIEDVKGKSFLENPKSAQQELTNQATDLTIKAKNALLENVPGLKGTNDKLAKIKNAAEVLGKASEYDPKAGISKSKQYADLLSKLNDQNIRGSAASESIDTLQSALNDVPEAEGIKKLLSNAPETADIYRLAGDVAKDGMGKLGQSILHGMRVGVPNIVGQIPGLSNVTQALVKGATSEVATQIPAAIARTLAYKNNGSPALYDSNNLTDETINKVYGSLGDDAASQQIKADIESMKADPAKRAVLGFKLSQNPKFREAMNK